MIYEHKEHKLCNFLEISPRLQHMNFLPQSHRVMYLSYMYIPISHCPTSVEPVPAVVKPYGHLIQESAPAGLYVPTEHSSQAPDTVISEPSEQPSEIVLT